MEENRFEIPKADYFTLNYNIYCGSMDGFNYRLNAKSKETLTVSVWLGRLCLEKSELAAEESFRWMRRAIRKRSPGSKQNFRPCTKEAAHETV